LAHTLAKSNGNWNARNAGVVIVVLAVADLLTLLPSGLYGHLIGSAILFCFLPGFLLISWAFASAHSSRRQVSWGEIILLGSVLSYLITTVTILLFSYVLGPIHYPALLSIFNALVLALLYLNLRAQVRWPASLHLAVGPVNLVVIVGIILVAGFLRLGNLGYSEYVGDEAEVVYRARQVILGDQEELFLQRKGPPQIMMTAAFALGTNGFNELALRFPFAWASLLAVWAVYQLGKSVWNERIGLSAAAILAIDGIVVGFSRLVQYQGLVLLTLIMIIYCLHRMIVEANGSDSSISADPSSSAKYLALSFILTALALLTHYETALIGLPMAMILYQQLARRHEPGSPFLGVNLKVLVLSGAIALVILLIFYVPFTLHPHFSDTVGNYGYRRIGIGKGGPFNNIDRYVASSIFYNSLYYVAITALLWIWGTAKILASTVPARRIFAYSPVAILIVGASISMLVPSSLTIGGRSFAFLFFLPVIALAVVRLRASAEQQAILVWFWLSFVAYAFFIRVPGLHYYTMAPAGALVAAVALDAVFDRLGMYSRLSLPPPRHWFKWGAIGLISATLVGYPYLVFVKRDPPYAVDFPDHRTVLYWTPQDQFPEGGFFGFPRHSGWKVLAVLYHEGELRGTYMSNKKQIKPEWTYMRSPVQEEHNPRYFFYDTLSERMTQTEKYPLAWVEENFKLVGYVRVNGKERIRIFERASKADSTNIRYYDAERYEEMYEQIDWLSEYRRAYQQSLNDNDLFELGNYLEAQALSPRDLLIFDDILIDKALNYYYAGDAARMTLPSFDEGEWYQADLPTEIARVFLVGLRDIEGKRMSSSMEKLARDYSQMALSEFGSLVVVALEVKK